VKNEFTEFELEREGFRVRFRRGVDAYETGASGASRELAGSSGQDGTTLSTGESESYLRAGTPWSKSRDRPPAEDPDLHLVLPR